MTVFPSFAAPLCTVEKVLELGDDNIRVARTLENDEPYFAGHFPEYPIFPGVFILEAVHQATSYYVAHHYRIPKRLRLVQVHSIRFLSPLRPGIRFEVVCFFTLIPKQDELLVEAQCLREAARPVAKAKLRYAVLNGDDTKRVG